MSFAVSISQSGVMRFDCPKRFAMWVTLPRSFFRYLSRSFSSSNDFPAMWTWPGKYTHTHTYTNGQCPYKAYFQFLVKTSFKTILRLHSHYGNRHIPTKTGQIFFFVSEQNYLQQQSCSRHDIPIKTHWITTTKTIPLFAGKLQSDSHLTVPIILIFVFLHSCLTDGMLIGQNGALAAWRGCIRCRQSRREIRVRGVVHK